MADNYVKSYNAKEAKKDGKPLTIPDRIILLRSYLTHSENQYSGRKWHVSWSFTMADGANGARFKKITYSHPKRWVTDRIELSNAEEDRSFAEACRLADVTPEQVEAWATDDSQQGILQGPNHAKYDLKGLLTHCLKKSPTWWVNIVRSTVWCWTVFVKPDEEDCWCSEGVCWVNQYGTFCRVLGSDMADTLDPQELHEALVKEYKAKP